MTDKDKQKSGKPDLQHVAGGSDFVENDTSDPNTPETAGVLKAKGDNFRGATQHDYRVYNNAGDGPASTDTEAQVSSAPDTPDVKVGKDGKLEGGNTRSDG